MLHSGASLPSFEGATAWIEAEPEHRALIGRAVLVQFWALSCYLCKEQMPALVRWAADEKARGLEVISVHTPRQHSDCDADAVRRAAAELGLRMPVAIDSAHAIADRFEIGGLWPHYFLFDRAGKLRARAAGGRAVDVLESALPRVLAEAA